MDEGILVYLPLHGVKSGRVRPQEKPAGRDKRSGKRCNALKALTKVQSRGGVLGGPQDGDVRIGRDL